MVAATIGSSSQSSTTVDGLTRVSYILGDMRRGFLRWSPSSTVAGELDENRRETRHFDDSHLLYKRNSIDIRLGGQPKVGGRTQRSAVAPEGRRLDSWNGSSWVK